MARGSKEKYTAKQLREARDIEEGYVKRGFPRAIAARIAWATVNKLTGGGKKSGSGRGKKVRKPTGKRRVGKVTSRSGRKITRTSSKKQKPTRTRRTPARRKKK